MTTHAPVEADRGGEALGSVVAGAVDVDVFAPLESAPIGNQATLLAAAAADPPRPFVDRLGPGRPLDPQTRQRMESAFGASFSHVRVHAGPEAGQQARAASAEALTVGHHIAFANGNYRPGTLVGDALLAHELAHTVQQRNAAAPDVAAPTTEPAGSALESDAELATAGAMLRLWGAAKQVATAGFRQTRPALQSGLRVQRCSCGGGSPEAASAQKGDIAFTENGTKDHIAVAGTKGFDPVTIDGHPGILMKSHPVAMRASVWAAGGVPSEASRWSAGFTQTVFSGRRVANYRSAQTGEPAVRLVSTLPRPALDGDSKFPAPFLDRSAAFPTSPSKVDVFAVDAPGSGARWEDDDHQVRLASMGGTDTLQSWLTVRHSGNREPVYLTWDAWELHWQADLDFTRRKGIVVPDQGARPIAKGKGRGARAPVLQPPFANDLIRQAGAQPKDWDGKDRE
jgi:hypothetical protein